MKKGEPKSEEKAPCRFRGLAVRGGSSSESTTTFARRGLEGEDSSYIEVNEE